VSSIKSCYIKLPLLFLSLGLDDGNFLVLDLGSVSTVCYRHQYCTIVLLLVLTTCCHVVMEMPTARLCTTALVCLCTRHVLKLKRLSALFL